ncbi:MAG: hypothetical protein IPI03_14495 [Rubrivivax sp.]|nr:hypothetical protein [Rubrivivax sp.]
MKRAAKPREVLASSELPPEFIRRLESPQAKVWVRLGEILQSALADEAVAQSPGAHEFAQVALELASDALSKDSALAALLPLDGLLPKGAAYVRFSSNSGRGEGPVKKLIREVLPKLERHLRRKPKAREVWDACSLKRTKGLKFVCSVPWGSPLEVQIEGNAPASYERFAVAVSEVRRKPKT